MLTVEFKKPFKLGIAEWDESNTAESIHIQEPTGKMSGYLGELEQQLGFAFANSMKLSGSISDEQIDKAKDAKAEEKPDEETEAKTILTQLAMGNADMSKCYKLLKKCISTGSARAAINGSKIVTEDIFDCIPHTELRRVLGYFCVNFTNILD
jgi:hypothetical protein